MLYNVLLEINCNLNLDTSTSLRREGEVVGNLLLGYILSMNKNTTICKNVNNNVICNSAYSKAALIQRFCNCTSYFNTSLVKHIELGKNINLTSSFVVGINKLQSIIKQLTSTTNCFLNLITDVLHKRTIVVLVYCDTNLSKYSILYRKFSSSISYLVNVVNDVIGLFSFILNVTPECLVNSSRTISTIRKSSNEIGYETDIIKISTIYRLINIEASYIVQANLFRNIILNIQLIVETTLGKQNILSRFFNGISSAIVDFAYTATKIRLAKFRIINRIRKLKIFRDRMK